MAALISPKQNKEILEVGTFEIILDSIGMIFSFCFPQHMRLRWGGGVQETPSKWWKIQCPSRVQDNVIDSPRI